VKRGLITWDKSETSPEVFAKRVDRVRRVLAERNLPALVVYSELWRSNQARFFSNFMPYFNRALLIIPREQPSTLLCGLSPRVYGWIRSVTTIEDVRPAGNFAKPFFEIANERKWQQVGLLDFAQFPYDIHKSLRDGLVGLVDVSSSAVFLPSQDDAELALRRKAMALTKQILEEEIPGGVGLIDHHFVGRLERRFRRAGAEDLIVLITNGRTVPAPPTGATLEENFSVSVAMEYRGNWVRISRPHGSARPTVFDDDKNCMERLDSGYPYEWNNGRIQAKHTEFNYNGKRLFYGDMNL
jgi:hypothetical protein